MVTLVKGMWYRLIRGTDLQTEAFTESSGNCREVVVTVVESSYTVVEIDLMILPDWTGGRKSIIRKSQLKGIR